MNIDVKFIPFSVSTKSNVPWKIIIMIVIIITIPFS